MFKDELKLVLYGKEHIIIKNFKLLKDISEEYISVDDYLIVGNFLKITMLDEGIIELYGKIQEIKVII